MADASIWLPVVWTVLIGFAVAMYVILDGFDLGVGILFPLFRSEQERDLMMNSVAPFWDGNETWLVLGGGGLLAAFPLAYAIVMPAFYLPITVMLLALIFRGVAFEFRWVAKPRHKVWDMAFAGGSIIAAFAQGIVLGGLLHGVDVHDGAFAGGSFDWLSPFALFVGMSVVAGYALLGATWLSMRVAGDLETRTRKIAKPLLLCVVAAMFAVSIWTPLTSERIFERWFTVPNLFYFMPLPVMAAVAALMGWWGLKAGRPAVPFVASIALFLLGYAGLAISNAPYLVPPSVTLWQAAAAPSSQMFMLVGAAVMLPVILGYTVFVYWTFRGKIKPGEGYH